MRERRCCAVDEVTRDRGDVEMMHQRGNERGGDDSLSTRSRERRDCVVDEAEREREEMAPSMRPQHREERLGLASGLNKSPKIPNLANI